MTSPTGPVARPGNVGAPCDVTVTSRVAEYNDLDGLEPSWRTATWPPC